MYNLDEIDLQLVALLDSDRPMNPELVAALATITGEAYEAGLLCRAAGDDPHLAVDIFDDLFELPPDCDALRDRLLTAFELGFCGRGRVECPVCGVDMTPGDELECRRCEGEQ
ncbi:MAG: hypothetical protein GWN87_32055 [Desulfuromonadales bacterium]|nr:hypothetical protein [Desulfuromonadales bacterium]